MENLKIGEGLLELNAVGDVIENSPSFTQLLENWKHFARKLGVSETTILTLSTKFNVGSTHIQEIPHELLRLWRAEKGDRATLKSLCNALAKCRIQDISELLEREYWLIAVKSLKIRLPNEVVTLGDLLVNAPERTFQQIYGELKKNTCTQPIQLLRDNVDPQEEMNYYVPRTLSYTNEVNEDIFRTSPEEHIFLVNGVSKNELAKLSGYKPVDVSGNQFHDITVRFMVLERDEDFKRICEKTADPVHVIEYRNGSYIWIKSKKGLDTIQRYKTGLKNPLTEDEFIEEVTNTSPPKAVSISDSPGMGKSFLLANLALKIKRKNNSFVVLITLDEFAKQITQPIDSSHSALAAIAEYASAGEATKLVLQIMLENSENKFDLFLDAYDEVRRNQRHIVNALLHYLSELQNFRVFVTTRTHLGHQLEHVLNILSYEIMPFNESNQVQFLTEYWIDKHGAERGELLKNYAQQSLKTLHKHMTDTERGIAGVPLQCRMLGEVLGKDAERASKFESESTRTMKITSLFDMYKNLVDLKFERLSAESWDQLRNEKANYVKKHVYYSTMLLFPDWVEKLAPCLEGFDKIDENKLYLIGLMEKSPDSVKPRFVHRTFAEYILTEFLVKNDNIECVEMIFSCIVGRYEDPEKASNSSDCNDSEWDFSEEDDDDGWDGDYDTYKMKYPVMAWFINMHLKHQMQRISMKELVLTMSKHQNKIDIEDLSKAIAACTGQDVETFFRFTMKLFKFSDIKFYKPEYITTLRDKYFRLLLHFAVERYDSANLIKKVMNLMKIAFGVDVNYYAIQDEDEYDFDIPWIVGLSPLHVASYHGKYNITTYLVKEYGENIKNLNHLLHLCVIKTSDCSEFVIQDKLSIIDLLQDKATEYNLNWINEKLDGSSPLLQKYVHLKLLDRLVDMGYNVNAYSDEKGTVLHTSGKRGSWKELLCWALSKGFNLINHPDGKGKTPHLMAMKNEFAIDEETVELLNNAGANFNSQDEDGISVLFYAVISQTTGVISKIIDYGANVNHESASKNNAAHFLFRKYKGEDFQKVLTILNLLILKGFTLLNRADSNGVTPFECMIQNVTDFDDPQLFDLFHSHGTDFNTKSAMYDARFRHIFTDETLKPEPEPVLFHTLGKISYGSIAKIIECGGDVNYVNKRNRNAAHITIKNSRISKLGSEEVIKVLKLLIFNGFTKIDEADMEGFTPLLVAANVLDMDEKLLDFFHENQANFNAMDKKFGSVLGWAIASQHGLGIISKLLELGADMFPVSHAKWNALHSAAFQRNSSALEFFIDKFDINSVDQYGSTPLHLVVQKEQPMDEKLLDLFRKRGANFNAVDKKGLPVLFYAIKGNQNQNILSKILKYGADLNQLSPKEANALHIAANQRNSSVLELVIDKFDINSTDKIGFTPLHYLVLKEEPLNEELLDLFHKKGANFDVVDKDGFSVLYYAINGKQNRNILSKILNYGGTLNHRYCNGCNALHIAATRRNSAALEFFIGKFDTNSVNQYGSTPLHQLFLEEEPLDEKLLGIFYEAGANFNAVNILGSVLINAIQGNQNATIISKIIEYGGDPHYHDCKNNALWIAAGWANTSAMEYLLDNFDYDINAVNDNGDSALHKVFVFENIDYREVLKLLLKHGSKFDLKNSNGYVPLVRWIIEGENALPSLIELQDLLPITNDIASDALTALIQQDIILGEHLINSSLEKKEVFDIFIEMLISKGGKLLQNDGSPIHWNEISEGYLKVLDQIVVGNHKLEQFILQTNDQSLCLVHSAKSNCMNFSLLVKDYDIPVETLLKGLLNTNQHDVFFQACSELTNILYNIKYLPSELFGEEFDINAVDKDGLTLLHRLVSNEKPVNPKILKLLHKKGANFNAANESGQILIHAIRCNKSERTIRIIERYGGDVYCRDSRNNNALHIAGSCANFSALKYLLQYSHNFNFANDDGDTPLHKLFSYEDRDYRNVLELLLKYKSSDFDIKNNKGYAPLPNWIINGKIHLSTLLELQDLLPITSEIASSALTALLKEETLLQEHLINSSEQKKDAFEKFFKLLKSKGGKVLRNDGSLIEWEKVRGESFPALHKMGVEVMPQGYLRFKRRHFHTMHCIMCSVLERLNQYRFYTFKL